MRCRAARLACALFAFLALSSGCEAQVTFRQAIDLAVKNSPRVKAAQIDLDKAKAGLRVLKDIYIPSVMLGGGAGDAYGIMLTVPTIFTVNAQSLVYSQQQHSYIRAAHSDLNAAALALEEVRQQVEEDAAITYLSLDRAQDTAAALDEQYQYAQRLVAVVQDRVTAKLDSNLELEKTRRGALGIRLGRMQAQDDLEDLRGHLAQITGIPVEQLRIVPQSIAAVPADSAGLGGTQQLPDTPGVQAAMLNAKAKEQRAKGDTQYTWRPIVSFGASYGRVSPIENVQKFYNLNGIYNVASFGVGIQLPVLDRVRVQAGRQSLLDAQRAQMDVESERSDELAGRHKLQRSIPELTTKAEMAELDDQIAQDQVNTAEMQSHHATGAPLVTPKEILNGHIDERQKYIDMLDARFQAHKAEISLLRLNGQLDHWMQAIDVQMKP